MVVGCCVRGSVTIDEILIISLSEVLDTVVGKLVTKVCTAAELFDLSDSSQESSLFVSNGEEGVMVSE
jgi:hypothetical protein